ncbi:PadR family transcriptional regulator [soil metagenome]
MIELAVLGVLREGELHGYELRKRLRELVGGTSSISFGSLYPALGRLERDGALEAVEALEPTDMAAAVAAVPITGSLSGELAAYRAARAARSARHRVGGGSRRRKVFRLTSAGEARLTELVAAPDEDDRTFGLKLALCRWCDPAIRLALFERRRAAVAERRDEARRSVGPRSRLDQYRRSFLEREAEVAERDLAWLDGLIAAERPAVDTTRPPDHQTTGAPAPQASPT